MRAKQKIKNMKIYGLKLTKITKNSDDYDKKYMKIKFNSDDELPLNKAIEIPSLKIVVSAIFFKITNIIHKLF